MSAPSRNAHVTWQPQARQPDQQISNASPSIEHASMTRFPRAPHQTSNNPLQRGGADAVPKPQIETSYQTSNMADPQRITGARPRNPSTLSLAPHTHRLGDSSAMPEAFSGPYMFLDSHPTTQHDGRLNTMVGSIDHASHHAVGFDASMAARSTSSNAAMITTANDIKTVLRDRIPQDQPGGSVYKGYIRGIADFQRQHRQYLSLSYRPAAFAGDFPTNDQALTQLAKGLSDAMLDFDGAVETGQKSVARIFQLSPYEVELKSWEFLFVLRDVQLGRVGLPGWGKLWAGEDFDCFMDRYNDAVNKLHVSKSIVSSMFDQDFSVRLALAPASELKKKIANMNNNARRAVELAMVRGMKKRKMENDAASFGDMSSGSVAKSREEDPAQMLGRIPSLSGQQRTQTYSTAGDQFLGGGHHYNKRARTEGPYTTSTDGHQRKDFTQTGIGTDDMNGVGGGERNRVGLFAPPELVDTPGFTPSSDFTEFPGDYTGYTTLPVGESNIAKKQDLGMDLNALEFPEAQDFNSTSDIAPFNAAWSHDIPNEAFDFDAANNQSRGSKGSNLEREDFDLPDNAAMFDMNWNSGDLELDPEQDHAMPVDALTPNETGVTGEALAVNSGDSFGLNAADFTVDDLFKFGDDLVLDAEANVSQGVTGVALEEDPDVDGLGLGR